MPDTETAWRAPSRPADTMIEQAIEAAARFLDLRIRDASELIEEVGLALDAPNAPDLPFLNKISDTLGSASARLRDADGHELLRNAAGWSARNKPLVMIAAAGAAALAVNWVLNSAAFVGAGSTTVKSA